ncbi:MAG: methyltransferase domain-containing protein, partial [Pedobacter sp.]
MERDEVYREQYTKPSDFKFSSKVAGVFDDMVNRSVPYYEEMQRMTAELAADHALPGTSIYDLGCSTGTTMIHMNELVDESIHFVGVDDSQDMLDKCRTKLVQLNFKRPFDLVIADLNRDVQIQNASVVVLCLTLQFVRP